MRVPLDGYTYDVDYDTEGGGGGPSYSPMSGADSGDPLVVLILGVYHDEYGPALLSDDDIERVADYVTEHHEFDDAFEDL